MPTIYTTKKNNKKIIITNHGAERAIKRLMKDIGGSEMLNFFEKMAWKEPKRYGHYLFFSRQLNQGMVVEYTEDTTDDTDKDKHFVIVTILPYSKKRPKSGTELRYVDSKCDEIEVIKIDVDDNNFLLENEIDIFSFITEGKKNKNKIKNPVKKNMDKFSRPSTHKDKKKEMKRGKSKHKKKYT